MQHSYKDIPSGQIFVNVNDPQEFIGLLDIKMTAELGISVDDFLAEATEPTAIVTNVNNVDGIYIFLINEISSYDLNGLFLSMDDYGFYAIFPSNGELINQGYDEGEYNTGYFNMDNEEAYTYAYIDDDGSYNPKEGRETIVMQYNEAVKNFTK